MLCKYKIKMGLCRLLIVGFCTPWLGETKTRKERQKASSGIKAVGLIEPKS
jgi:hypothetical protein